MINKEIFVKAINNYKYFTDCMEGIANTLAGKNSYVSIDFWECDWYEAVTKLFDTFIDSHFTQDGQDLIYWWMYEDVDKVITVDNTEYSVESIEDLWKYIETYSKDYLLNG